MNCDKASDFRHQREEFESCPCQLGGQCILIVPKVLACSISVGALAGMRASLRIMQPMSLRQTSSILMSF